MPNLKKSDITIMNNLTFWGTMLKNIRGISQFENLLKGAPIVERAQAEVDDKKEYKKTRKKRKKG